MSTHDSLIELTDTLIQQNGYQGFSYGNTEGQYPLPFSDQNRPRACLL